MLKKIFYKKYKIQLFPFIFKNIQGDSFKQEEFFLNQQKKRIEFFFLHQSKYNNYFLEMNQFVIWTIEGDICRVLIEKDYYNQFKELYQKEINIFYANFLYSLLEKRRDLIYIDFLLIFNFICFTLFFALMIKIFINYFKFWFFLFIFFIFFVVIFIYFRKKRNDFFYKFKKESFLKTIKKTKVLLGEEKFESILKKQNFFSLNLKKK
ncbi:hypothetical protein AXA84_0098 [Candidatus Phytoplasma oryzae]|uniref:Uncharacterized protein n=1 Tax=Candidatus Phytoplasma oryzae TaxID=203274 RepID=A0A139JR45_9MOLU|nr:hypothetical protein [Candidatus Phytoplasma oryzae]KXT29453.1 hypothetical protein AXA84_0098 [Candidatus Phytoplasma oryzae]RAM58032.1 hypothetical protein DH96_00560 [Candidatus Phytoplasma oryzae]